MLAGIIGSGVIAAGGVNAASVILETETDNLEWYFPCDDASGGLRDASGNGFDLTGEVGTITYGVDGQSGKAVNLGSTGYISTGAGDTDPANINISGDGFTILYLISPNVVADVNGVFRADSGTSNRIIHRMEALGDAFIGLLDNVPGSENDNFSDVGSPGHFVVDTWRLGCIRVSAAGQVDFFSNNSKNDTARSHANTGSADYSLFEIGRAGTTAGERGDFKLQHLAAWSVPLSDQQIADIVSAAGLS